GAPRGDVAGARRDAARSPRGRSAALDAPRDPGRGGGEPAGLDPRRIRDRLGPCEGRRPDRERRRGRERGGPLRGRRRRRRAPPHDARGRREGHLRRRHPLLMALLLAIDVGNTNTVLGFFRGEKLEATARVTTVRERTSDEHILLLRDLFLAKGVAREDVKDVIVSSVVPSQELPLRAAARDGVVLAPLI